MPKVTVYHYDAFSTTPTKGNPAGIVLNGEHLTEEQMQEIAQKVGFNETSFPVQSDVADVRIRYFTPGHEMDLCGHATVATIYALISKGLLSKDQITIETRAGILAVKVSRTIEDEIVITMQQRQPRFEKFEGSVSDLAASIGLLKEEIDTSFPIMYGNTGIWTVIIPIKKLSSFQKMKPNNQIFPDILKEIPTASLHPICTETYDLQAQLHGRHFSSPFSGTIEDPVTGTASGVMGAYYATYMSESAEEGLQLIVEQGQEIGKDGRVEVTVTKNETTYDIEITGTAVYVNQFELSI